MSFKKALIVVLSFSLLGLTASPTFAKRLLPRARRAGSTKSTTTSSGKIGISVKFRGDRRAVITSFSNLKSARIVNYTLSYHTRGTTQGAGGTINPATTGNAASRELLFGTCSHGVCRYDSGITNAKLVVVYTRQNGKRYSKTFRLKV